MMNCRPAKLKVRTSTLALLVLLACGPGSQTTNQAATNDLKVTELRVKAGFLYNFAAFTSWPSNLFVATTNTLTVGVIGQDDFGPIVKRMLTGKQISSQRIEFRQCATVADARCCQVLYIGDEARGDLPEILRQLEGTPVLTVGECPRFTERGGMIGLTKTNDRVVFQVNLKAARRAGLTISSKLLRLATRIVDTGPAPESP